MKEKELCKMKWDSIFESRLSISQGFLNSGSEIVLLKG